MLVGILLEGADVCLACLERAAGILDSIVEVHGHDVVHRNHGRGPAAGLDAAVKPVDVTVGTMCGGDLLCDAQSSCVHSVWAQEHVLVAPGLPQDESVMRMSPLALPSDLEPEEFEPEDVLLLLSVVSAVG